MFKSSTINHLYPRMNRILPNLFLGDVEASQDLESLNSHNITHIVSILARESFLVPTHNHILITLNDGIPYRPVDFELGVKFIKKAINANEGVLVHCMAGISRSSTMVGAYLMKEHKLSPIETINLLKKEREIIDPAYFTFQSAINWAYPNSNFICGNCDKIWDYREEYEFINYVLNDEENKIFHKEKNVRDCECENPIILILPK